MEAFAIKSAVIAGHSLFINAVGDIYVLVRNSATHPQVNAVLNELDLSADLKVVESLIIKENSAIDHDDPLHISIEQVNEMVQKIKHELEEINKIIENHQNAWFANWRTPDCSVPLENIKSFKVTLDKRLTRYLQLRRG